METSGETPDTGRGRSPFPAIHPSIVGRNTEDERFGNGILLGCREQSILAIDRALKREIR